MASFNEAFKAARKAQGAGGTFTWKGNSYSTNIAGETGKKKAPSFSTDMVEKAINRKGNEEAGITSSPRPHKRPVTKLPKEDDSNPMSGVAAGLAAIGTGAAILASGLKSRSGAGGAGRASAKLLPAQSTVLRLPAPPKALPAPDARRAEDKDSKKTTGKNVRMREDRKARKTISPKNASPVSQNSRRSGRVGGPMMGDDPMYNAIQGGGFGAIEDLGREGLINMKRGGVVKMKEGSAKDMREDKAMAKKHGMTMKQHEASAADKKHDAPKKMATGGVVKKMNYGGMASERPMTMNKGGVAKKAGGGSMRGAGCAVRGKGFSGSY